MKIVLADLFYEISQKIDSLDAEIEAMVNPKQVMAAMGKWLELNEMLDKIARSIVNAFSEKPVPASIMLERIRELRLSIGSRMTEKALNILNVEISGANKNGKIPFSPLDARFSGRR